MATTITRESMTDNVTVWNVTRIGSAIYDRIDTILGAALTLGGVLTVEGYGSHIFTAGGAGANTLTLRNTTSGTGAYAGLLVGNNSTAALGALFGFSSAYTTAGAYFASGVTLESTGTGGLQLFASNASGPIRMYTGGTQRLAIDSAGVLTPLNSLTICAGFFAYNSASDAGVANNTDIDFDTEVYDEQSNFSGDTFTAPVAGRYLLSAHVRLTNSTGGAIVMQPVFLVSNHAWGSTSAMSLWRTAPRSGSVGP